VVRARHAGVRAWCLDGSSQRSARCAQGEDFGDHHTNVVKSREGGVPPVTTTNTPGAALRPRSVTSQIFRGFPMTFCAQARGFHQSQLDAVERTHDHLARPGVLCEQPFRLCPCEHCRHRMAGGAGCSPAAPGKLLAELFLVQKEQRGQRLFVGRHDAPRRLASQDRNPRAIPVDRLRNQGVGSTVHVFSPEFGAKQLPRLWGRFLVELNRFAVVV
jgi:hypothetical protein